MHKKYITNFTTPNIRVKILSASELVEGIGTSIIIFLAGLLLEYYTTSIAYLAIGIVGIIIILLVLSFMRARFGLNPEEYDKEDIEYIED